MTQSRMIRFAVVTIALGIVAGLAGCATPGVVVSPAPTCEMPARELGQQCALPLVIPADASYEALLTIYQQDRDNAIECRRRHRVTLELMQICIDNQKAYNQTLKTLEKK